MPTPSEIDSARTLILESCFELFAKSPAAWAIWHRADVQAHDAMVQAALRLQDDGHIKATLAADHTIIHAQLTMAGLRYLEGIEAGGGTKGA